MRPRRVRITRDAVVFTTGLLGVLHETIFSQVERPTLLVLFAAMIGLPFAQAADRRRHDS